jgi:hypothetical protein
MVLDSKLIHGPRDDEVRFQNRVRNGISGTERLVPVPILTFGRPERNLGFRVSKGGKIPNWNERAERVRNAVLLLS